MRLIREAKAGQFRDYEIRNRNKTETLKLAARAQLRRGLGVLGPHLLAGEDQVDGATSGRFVCLHKHIEAGNVAVLESSRLCRFRYPLEILTPNQNGYIFGQPTRFWFGFLHV